mmetsp:Transcript_23043/g.39600  ORF Transcript_23043/g.39600 Transcript_23043/m.39600 type:complete len:88 (+) Transcript_23043:131-394(+)
MEHSLPSLLSLRFTPTPTPPPAPVPLTPTKLHLLEPCFLRRLCRRTHPDIMPFPSVAVSLGANANMYPGDLLGELDSLPPFFWRISA